MSRVFKSSYVNFGEPRKVELEEQYFNIDDNYTDGSSDEDKSSDPNITASNIIARANREANLVLEKVNSQISEMLAHAKSEAEATKQEIYDGAYYEGFQKGLNDGKAETEELAQQALIIKEELERERENLVSSLEVQIPDLVIDCIRKVIGQELSTNKNIIKNLVSNALRKVNTNNIAVRVSDDNFQIVQDSKNEIMFENRHISELDIKKDAALTNGDCIIETNCGEVDSSCDIQISRIKDAISNVSKE